MELQQIDEITIRSSFLNSEVSKLLSITIRDIRVNKDINDTSTTDTNEGRINDDDVAIDPNLNVCDFRNKKVPPSIIKFAQVNDGLFQSNNLKLNRLGEKIYSNFFFLIFSFRSH